MLHAPMDGGAHAEELPGTERPSLDPSKQTDRCRPEEVLLDYDPPRDEFRVKPASVRELLFRHSHWYRRRNVVFRSLQRLHVSANRLDRFAQCGAGCCVYFSPSSGDWKLRASYCRDRVCQACGSARSAVIADTLARHCQDKHTRFVTLTLKHQPIPLADQIDRCYRAFSTLRRRTWWKSCVTGGAAFLEVKVGRDSLWHVHLHMIVEGKFVDQRKLGSEWHAVTGDSYVVDVRAVGQDQKEVRYAAAYAGKPLDKTICDDPSRLDEFIVAIKGRRLALTFGTWRGLDLDGEPTDLADDWIPVGSLDRLWSDAAAGDLSAQNVLICLQRRRTLEVRDTLEAPA